MKNMKNLFLVLSAVIMKAGFTGCSGKPYTYDVAHDNDNRFQIVYSQSMYPSVGRIEVVIDKETNIKYMIVVKRGEGTGVTKLEE